MKDQFIRIICRTVGWILFGLAGLIVYLWLLSATGNAQKLKTKNCRIEYITVSEPFVGRCVKIRDGEYRCRIRICTED